MVNVKTPKRNKWGRKMYTVGRRYKLFFIIGFVILSVQIILSVRFVSINKDEKENLWQPKNDDLALEIVDFDAEINSARKSKLEVTDDEDQRPKYQKETIKNVTTIPKNLQLKTEDLNFTPPCTINVREAISAIHRAKTQYCKQVISNITCLSLSGNLYPKLLKSLCPAGNYSVGRSLGCYKDEKAYRILTGFYAVNKILNSPQHCITACQQAGFQYAGMQYQNECFCGNDEPPFTAKLPDPSCNMKCPGGSEDDTCGGYYTMNVYETGIKKFSAQIANTENSSTRKPVRIVFLLTLNGRALRQVTRLIKILYDSNHYYYIHVDVRQDYLFRELLKLEKEFPNIRLTRSRYATIWGGASLLEMLLNCMAELLEISDWKWDFVLNLSESDFPVKTVGQLTDFLSANRDKNFVKSHGRETHRFVQKQGLDKTFVECETRMWRIGDRTLPSGIQVDGGSDWVSLSRKFVSYVALNQDDLVTGLYNIFKHTLLPAESFFHTVLRNSKFCNTYIDNNLHVTNWKRKLGCKCQYKHIVDWCGCSPNDFRTEDWPRILNTQSRQLFFARKFEPIVSQTVILHLELWLHGIDTPSHTVQNLHSYWQNIYDHNDLGTKDDSLLTLGYSIKRLTQNILKNSSCNVNIEKLLEITSYHHKDNYKYTLFKYTNYSEQLEIGIKPINHLNVFKPSPLMEHLETIHVSSDYDPKEQMSRNFMRILSPYSDPVFIYQFKTHKTSKFYNMTLLWIDPVGKLQEFSEFLIDENNLIGSVKNNLKQPHLPGVWTVKLIYKTTNLASVKYLIMPLEFSKGVPISFSQVQSTHGGSLTMKENTIPTKFSSFLPKGDKVVEDLSTLNSRLYDKELQKWIDSLVTQFYAIEKVCGKTEEKAIEICGRLFNSCVRTSWSSFSPDPKSVINARAIKESSNGSFYIW